MFHSARPHLVPTDPHFSVSKILRTVQAAFLCQNIPEFARIGLREDATGKKMTIVYSKALDNINARAWNDNEIGWCGGERAPHQTKF